VKDAQRHGVSFRPVDVTVSGWACAIEASEVRLGLQYVRGLRKEGGERIASVRADRPFASLQDFVDRAFLRRDEQRILAEVGALNAFGLTRRSALWQVEKAGRPRGPLFEGDEAEAAQSSRAESTSPTASPHAGRSPLAEMTLAERLGRDLSGLGLTAGPHPLALYREMLTARGVRRSVDLLRLGEGQHVRVAGPVICRQRPGSAKGFMFLTLEDETGLVNVTVRPDMFERDHAVLVSKGVLEIDGVLQTHEGISVRALKARLAPIDNVALESRDFH
jgi:error-prone DNA polymerase